MLAWTRVILYNRSQQLMKCTIKPVSMTKLSMACSEKQRRNTRYSQSYCCSKNRETAIRCMGPLSSMFAILSRFFQMFFEESRPESSRVAVQTVREDVKGIEHCLDSKTDMLSAKLENLSLLINQSTGEAERPPVKCNYCQNKEHYSNKCRDTPMKNSRCWQCHKIGHTTKACFQRQMTVPRIRGGQSNNMNEKREEEVEKLSHPAPLGLVVKKLKPSLTTKSDAEENIISKR